jgi:hypothetical protein
VEWVIRKEEGKERKRISERKKEVSGCGWVTARQGRSRKEM